jgi:hypothetical protein
MALHCAATLLVVSSRDGAGAHAGAEVPSLAATYGPWPADVDVMSELQAIADQHRGERVLVTLAPDALAAVLAHLGRTSAPGGASDRLRLDVGDDGWVIAPWAAA